MAGAVSRRRLPQEPQALKSEVRHEEEPSSPGERVPPPSWGTEGHPGQRGSRKTRW